VRQARGVERRLLSLKRGVIQARRCWSSISRAGQLREEMRADDEKGLSVMVEGGGTPWDGPVGGRTRSRSRTARPDLGEGRCN
jgi:hypothetical protein